MPKKTIPVLPEDLRRDDVIKQTNYLIPVPLDDREFWRNADVYNDKVPYSGLQARKGFLVERVVDEKLTIVRPASDAGTVSKTIDMVIKEYVVRHGDLSTMTISTQSRDHGEVAVRLEGWIR